MAVSSKGSSRRGDEVVPPVTPKPPLDVRPASKMSPSEPVSPTTRTSQASEPTLSSAAKNESTISKMEKLVQTPSQAKDPDAEGNESELIRRAQHTASLSEHNNTERRSQGGTADGSHAGSSVGLGSSRASEMSSLDIVPDLSRHEADRRGRTRHRLYPVGGTNTRGARHGRRGGRRGGRRDGRHDGQHHRHHETQQATVQSIVTVVNAWATKLYAFGYFMAAILLALDWGYILGQGKMLRDVISAIVDLVKLCKKPSAPSPKVAAPIIFLTVFTMLPILGDPNGSGSGAPPVVFERPSHGRVLEQLSMQGHVLREARGLLDALEDATIATPMPNNFTKAKQIMAGGSADFASALREYYVHYRDWGNEAESFHLRLFSHNMTLQHYTLQRQSVPGPVQWILNLFGRSHDMDALAQFSAQLGGWYSERLDSLNATIHSFEQDGGSFKGVGLKVNDTEEAISWEGALSERDTKRWYALSASLQMSSKTISAALDRLYKELGALEDETGHIKTLQKQLADKREAMVAGVNKEAKRTSAEQLTNSMVSQMVQLLGG